VYEVPERFMKIFKKVEAQGCNKKSSYAITQWLYKKKYGHPADLKRADGK
jgi:hypothetical protein